jgi:hypothetical protein
MRAKLPVDPPEYASLSCSESTQPDIAMLEDHATQSLHWYIAAADLESEARERFWQVMAAAVGINLLNTIATMTLRHQREQNNPNAEIRDLKSKLADATRQSLGAASRAKARFYKEAPLESDAGDSLTDDLLYKPEPAPPLPTDMASESKSAEPSVKTSPQDVASGT